MPWYMYLLLCNQKTYYAGISSDLLNRLRQHDNQESFHTSKFSDLKFVYAEKYMDKYEAARREKQIKGWSHIKKQKLIESNIDPHRCTEIVEVMLGNDEKLVSLLRV